MNTTLDAALMRDMAVPDLIALMQRRERAHELLRRLDRDIDFTRRSCAESGLPPEAFLLLWLVRRLDLLAPRVLEQIATGDLEILDIAFLARFAKEEQELLLEVYDQDASRAFEDGE